MPFRTLLVKDDEQLTYYNSGIGTFVKDSHWFARKKQGIVHAWDMAVARCANLLTVLRHVY